MEEFDCGEKIIPRPGDSGYPVFPALRFMASMRYKVGCGQGSTLRTPSEKYNVNYAGPNLSPSISLNFEP